MSDLLSNVGGFATGFGQGLWGGAKGMVQGLGNLAEGAYGLATDPNARAQAWNDAVNAAQTVEWAAQNPGQAADAVGQGASNLYNNFVTAEQQAVANGQGAQFWGNVVGQGAFAAGTVLVPGLAEGKLTGALGEAGDASQALRAATTLEEAAPALGEDTAALTTAAEGSPVLPDPNALTFVPENAGSAQTPAGQVWRDYQSQTLGSDMDPLTGQSNVPALQFDNPNPNGNPYVKWDGYQFLPDGTTELIDAKTAISPFSMADGPFIPQSTVDQLLNKSAALSQNPGYSGVVEVPTDQVAADLLDVLDEQGITNIGGRVRPFLDATQAVPDAAAVTPNAMDANDTALQDAIGLGTGTTSPMSFPNTGNLLGAGLFGGDALGNLLSTPSQTDPTPAAPADTAPVSPPVLPDLTDIAPPLSPPPPALMDITPVSPPTIDPGPTLDSDPTTLDSDPIVSDPIVSDPTDDLGGDASAIDDGGDGGAMDDMADASF